MEMEEFGHSSFTPTFFPPSFPPSTCALPIPGARVFVHPKEVIDINRKLNLPSFPLLSPLFSYPNELFEYLRLVYLTPEDIQGKKLSDMDFTDPISLENELAAMASIESACEDVSGKEAGRLRVSYLIFHGPPYFYSSIPAFPLPVLMMTSHLIPPPSYPHSPAILKALASYSTKEEDDARLINDGKLFNMFPKTQRMAIKHRRSEKRLLKKTAAAVKQQLLNLKSGKRKLRPEEED